MKMLADEEVAAAQAELREQMERAAAGGAEGGAEGGGEAELLARVSSLEAELRLSSAQADRALADVADLQAEPPNPNPSPYPNPTLNPEGTPQHGGGRGDPLQLL